VGAGRFRFRYLGIYRGNTETDSRGAPWPRQGAQGRESQTISATPAGAEILCLWSTWGRKYPRLGAIRCRNTRDLGRPGAFMRQFLCLWRGVCRMTIGPEFAAKPRSARGYGRCDD